MKLAGHIKVFGGPYVARGQDVAQAWYKAILKYFHIFGYLVYLR